MLPHNWWNLYRYLNNLTINDITDINVFQCCALFFFFGQNNIKGVLFYSRAHNHIPPLTPNTVLLFICRLTFIILHNRSIHIHISKTILPKCPQRYMVFTVIYATCNSNDVHIFFIAQHKMPFHESPP